ncbi:MAG: threonine--tRNA ligase [Candidatus Eisenbacteria sp.]|nr:threonine--tRNA ligase [Candidatus Eisenbacteria bacterium]
MPHVMLPGGSREEIQVGSTLAQLAKHSLGKQAKAAVAAWMDGELRDLSCPIEGDCTIRFVTIAEPEGLDLFRHSSAHLMAEAVISLFPNAKPTIGPVVEEGFYYDFDHPPFTEEDLERIEKRMRQIVSEGRPMRRIELSRAEALEQFKDNPYKLEMIREMPEGETITAYIQGEGFTDLCRGPHVPDLACIRAFKLLKVAGAYWRGDSSKQMLQRIYGISFKNPKELKAYLAALEEAKQRDHRKLGRELDLFSFHEEGQGFPFWHDKGTIIYDELSAYIRQECRRRGYIECRTPMILSRDLWHRSGHWDHYADAMYFVDIDEKPYAIKPMNCPGGLLVYKTRLHSYRDLPIRQSELGLVHRNELSGVLHGLFRVRAFTQDDAHVFCTRQQLTDEVVKLIEFCIDVYRTFGFPDPEIKLSTKPEDHIGSDDVWELATQALHEGLQRLELDYKVDEGEGAFYGPKIDFDILDSLRRRWQCGTIQVDFSMPERFDLTYEASDGRPHRPVMLHRAILGSLERFIGILIEHTGGKLPLWISPEQARLIPISERHHSYASQVRAELETGGIRAAVDMRDETLGKRIRAAQLEKANYILVVGDKEVESHSVNVRTRDNKVHGAYPVPDLLAQLQEEIRTRKLSV